MQNESHKTHILRKLSLTLLSIVHSTKLVHFIHSYAWIRGLYKKYFRKSFQVLESVSRMQLDFHHDFHKTRLKHKFLIVSKKQELTLVSVHERKDIHLLLLFAHFSRSSQYVLSTQFHVHYTEYLPFSSYVLLLVYTLLFYLAKIL